MKNKHSYYNIFKYILLTIVTVLCVFPFYWMIITALKEPNSVLEFPPKLLPRSYNFSNFKKVFEMMPTMKSAYVNSITIAVCATLGTLFTSALAAYAFAKMKFRGKNLLFALLLGTLMIPSQVTLIPLYIVFAKLKWIDTFLPLIVPQVLTNAYGVFMIRQFMIRLPREYIEAAELDGCGYFKTFLTIMIPLCKPILMTLGLFTFIGSWNNYLQPLIFLNTESKFTIPLIVAAFRGVYTVQWELMMAAATVAIAPVIILFLISQKYFVESISLTGIK